MTFSKGMDPQISASRAAFAESLKSFGTGDISIGELLSALDRQLISAANATELLKILQDSELVAPMPPDVHEAVMARIKNKYPLSPGPTAYLADAPTIVLQEAGPHGDGESAPLPIRASVRRSSVTVGDVLQARFRLVELIAEGGMSRVYKALDLRRLEAGSQDPTLGP